MIINTKMSGTFLYSDNNKMGIFITPSSDSFEKETEMYYVAAKAYEDWMYGEDGSEDYAIGDWVIEQLSNAGYEKEEDYYMFYDSDWD